MSESENGNGKNGRLSFGQLLLAVIGSLITAGVVGLIVTTISLTSRISSLEATVKSISESYEKRITKIEGDVYTTRFSDRVSPTPRTANTPVPSSAQ